MAVLQAGMTPLLLAARFSSAELIRCLLFAGADIDACTEVTIYSYSNLSSIGYFSCHLTDSQAFINNYM